MTKLLVRSGLLVILLAALSALVAWFGPDTGLIGKRRATPAPAISRIEADAQQQGQPTSYAATLRILNTSLAAAAARLATPVPGWTAISDVGSRYLARAKLTGSYDDYARAGALFDRAFKAADPGTGPHLERASWNFALHRLAAAEPDLAAVEHYVIPDDGDVGNTLGLRGDIAFYRGDYARALDLYERSHARIRTIGTCFRLGNYWARMGDPEKARGYFDEAESLVSGPQQQVQSFLELNRGLLDLDRGDWPAAHRHFYRADRIFPGHWLIQERLAMVIGLRGRPERAMEMFKAIAARNQLPEAYDTVAGLYRSRGDAPNARLWAAKAEALWQDRLRLFPEAAYGHALDHYLAFGDPRQALAIAQRNYAARPFAESATGLAWAYLANRRPADAVRAIEPVLASPWVSAEPHIVAAEAYALLGQGETADAQRKAALAVNPHSFDRNPGLVWLEH